MKLRLFAAAGILVTAFAAMPSQAQQKPMTPAEIAQIKIDVSNALQDYAKTFAARDVNGIVDRIMANPEIIFTPEGPVALTPDKVREQYTKTFTALPENYVRSDWPSVTVCVLRRDLAIASGSFKRIAKDGSPLLEGSASYLYGRTKDGWKLISTLGVPPKKVVTCD
jgi:ketosteroid isomerase-like protein